MRGNSKSNAVSWIITICVVIVMIVFFFGPDWILPRINDSAENVLWFAYFNRFVIPFACGWALLGFYIYNNVEKFRKGKLPSNFWSPFHIVLKVIAAAILVFFTYMFIVDTSAVIKDNRSGGETVEYYVCNISEVEFAGSISFNVYDNDAKEPTDVYKNTYRLSSVTMKTGKRYSFVYYQNTNTLVAVKEIVEANND